MNYCWIGQPNEQVCHTPSAKWGARGLAPPNRHACSPIQEPSFLKTAAFVLNFKLWPPPDKRLAPLGRMLWRRLWFATRNSRIPSSARSSSYAAPCFSLSSQSTPNSSSTSATSIFSSQRHQDRLPHDLQKDAPSRPKLCAYTKNEYNCSFRDFLGQLGCRWMFCFTK